MKRVLRALLAGVAVLTVCVLMIAPYLIGRAIEKRLPALAEQLGDTRGFRAAIVAYERGWLASDLQIGFYLPQAQTPFATLSETLSHGPFLPGAPYMGLAQSRGALTLAEQNMTVKTAGSVSLRGEGSYTLSAEAFALPEGLHLTAPALWLRVRPHGGQLDLFVRFEAAEAQWRADQNAQQLRLNAALLNLQPDLAREIRHEGADALIAAMIAQGDAGGRLELEAAMEYRQKPIEADVRLETNAGGIYLPGNLASLLFKIKLHGNLKADPAHAAALYGELGGDGETLLKQAEKLAKKGYFKPLENGRDHLAFQAEGGNWIVGGKSVFQLLMDLR